MPASVATARREWLVRLGLAALLCGVVLIGYWPALHGGFIWDDKPLLTDSALIRASDGLRRFWLTTEAPDYWPLTSTSFWLEWRLWGMEPTGYHVTNLALHVVEACLLWVLLARLGVGGAFLAALLFAVHPVNVESVAWIAQRKNLVALLFLLPSALLYLESLPGESAARGTLRSAGWRYWSSLALFAMAMLGKGSVATLPALLLLLTWWRRGALTRRDVVRVTPFVLVAAILVLVNVWFQTHGTGPLRQVGAAERLLGAGAVVWFYLSKALLPVGLSFVYPQWEVNASHPVWWIPLLAAATASLALWRYRRGAARPVFVAWSFFVLALVPVMGLTDVYFMKYSLVADHYQHVALLGVVALVAAAWSRWQRRLADPLRPLAVVAAAVLVGLLTWLTARQSSVYRDEETLYRATIAANPDAWLAHYNLALELDASGRRQEAILHFEEAIRACSDCADAHNNLALALAAEGRAQEALAHAEQAVRIRPDLPEAQVDLGILLGKAGRPAEALPHLETAVRLRPASAEAQYNLGLVLAAVGHLPEALEHYREALRLDPGSADAHNALGTGLLSLGRVEEACAELRQALVIQPGNAGTLANLGLALMRAGRPQEAMDRYQEALRLQPSRAETHYNLGTLLAAGGRADEALSHYEQALRIRPDYAEAHNNLAVALAGKGRVPEARAHLEEAVRLRPDFYDAQVNLAELCARSGLMRQALSHARAALEVAPPAARGPLEQRIRGWGGRL